ASTLSPPWPMADASTLSPPCPNVSIDGYRNSLGLDSRLLGNLDLEHAIRIPCLDPLSSCRFRQGETAQERTGGAFEVLEAVVFYGLPRQSLAAKDRKSTRLNSSHVAISYAVFCLKKKRR